MTLNVAYLGIYRLPSVDYVVTLFGCSGFPRDLGLFRVDVDRRAGGSA